MKILRQFSVLSLVVFLVLLLQGCPETSSPDVTGKSVLEQFTSDNGGSLSTEDGAEIKVPTGAIGKKDNGDAGTVSISIEPNVDQTRLPNQIPSKFRLVGKIYAFGPAGFIFTEPVQIYLPASSESSPEGLIVLWYNEFLSEWVPVMINDIDAQNKKLGVSVFELGYFAIVREASSKTFKNDKPQSYAKSGGVRYNPSETNYYYTLTVVAATLDDPDDMYSGLIGSNGSTGSYPTGGPLPQTRLYGLPPGDYQIQVSRTLRGTLFNPPGPRQTYTMPASIRVNSFTNTFSWDWTNWSPWAELTLGGGEWLEGDPETWPKPTKPYGTGEFQATLNWVNTDASTADLDLHLFGPNDIHVYWQNDKSSDGSIELDRDWMSAKGSAVENIYSLSKMPSGEYKVYVNAFLGNLPKTFEVRIIRQGSVVNTIRATVTQGNIDGDISKMILIQTFRI